MQDIPTIIGEVAVATGIPAPAITGCRRTDGIVFARFLAVAAIRQAFPHMSLVELAEAVGRRDHGTAHNALRQFQNLCKTSPHFLSVARRLNLTTP
jgi:chromosomal replication initiation ATPase DnaA